MLKERARVVLFWFTLALILVVVAVAVVTLLRAWGGSSDAVPPLEISPPEVSLCSGGQRRFTAGGADITWAATGGTISEDGLFTAGDVPGDYTVTGKRADPRAEAEAVVHVVACTPTATPAPPATPTPAPTATALPTPRPTSPPNDARGDVTAYDSGAPVDGAPAGVDIRAASIAPDLRLSLAPSSAVPEELATWAVEGDLALWIDLYDPVPDPPEVYTEWLFALDLDGDTATGRPPGTVRINPDLGDDAVLGVSYDPATEEYVPYLLVWDTAQESWESVPDVVRYTLARSRTLVGIAVPLETLAEEVEQTTGVTVDPEMAKGRAAVLSYIGEQAVIDFYPDRPE